MDQRIIDAAVEVFQLGPEHQDELLRFAMKLEDLERQQEPIAYTTQLALRVSNKLAGTPHGVIDACAKNIWGDQGVALYSHPPATRLSEEELKRLTDFWESAWEDEGTREKIINELWDYTVFMENTIKVYDYLTRGNITKINTLPQAVIDEVERIHQQEIDEAVREAEVEEVRGLSVDELAQQIRIVDGSNNLGAAALAEALMPFIEQHR